MGKAIITCCFAPVLYSYLYLIDLCDAMHRHVLPLVSFNCLFNLYWDELRLIWVDLDRCSVVNNPK